jgi:hypothetical protein
MPPCKACIDDGVFPEAATSHKERLCPRHAGIAMADRAIAKVKAEMIKEGTWIK